MKKWMEDVWTWSVFSEEKQLYFNGLYLRLPQGSVLIDPPLLSQEDAGTIEQLGKPRLIILTNKDHQRGSESARERFGAKTLIHSLDKTLVEVPIDGAYEDHEMLVGQLQVVHLPDMKSPGESALYWRSKKILIVGDALIGKPPGGLNLLSPAKFADIGKAFESVKKRLGPLDFETLFVGDGDSLISGAKAAFQRFAAGFKVSA